MKYYKLPKNPNKPLRFVISARWSGKTDWLIKKAEAVIRKYEDSK